jgi:poly(A) polymerase
MQIYLVGGAVRDKILGIESKDLDYVMVLEDTLITPEAGFLIMKTYMEKYGFKIFLETPEMFTIRAKFPEGHKNEGIVGDFVLARKEIGYIEGTRKPKLMLGTLEDDLIRRDFTLNSLAEDSEGNIIDLFGGISDLKHGVLKTPLDCKITFNDDPLRIIRAIRFSITKGFIIPPQMTLVIEKFNYEEKMNVVSIERIREELYKCFKHNTLETLYILNYFSNLRNYIFKNNILWLKPTLEQ